MSLSLQDYCGLTEQQKVESFIESGAVHFKDPDQMIEHLRGIQVPTTIAFICAGGTFRSRENAMRVAALIEDGQTNLSLLGNGFYAVHQGLNVINQLVIKELREGSERIMLCVSYDDGHYEPAMLINLLVCNRAFLEGFNANKVEISEGNLTSLHITDFIIVDQADE